MRALTSVIRHCYDNHWTLGFIEQPLSEIVTGQPFSIHYVEGMPRDRWFADPFILDYDGQTIQLLVEEFCYKIRHGRIAKLLIDRKSYRLLSYKIILDLPAQHLSFPFIERKDGKVYISPESSASCSWSRYDYDTESGHLSKVKCISQEPLTDAIVTDLFGEELIFATHLPTQNGNVLTVYDAAGVKKQDIEFSSRVARNAGGWFKVGEKIYRPAQDCNSGYGRAVIIQEVTREGGVFCFKDIRRIESSNPQYNTGCHTFNNYKDLAVVDVRGWRRPVGVNVLSLIKKIIKGRQG